MDTKPEIRFLLIGWLMGVEQNSVYLSIILVVACAGLSDCEELVGLITGDDVVGHKSTVSIARYSHLSGEETIETGESISKRLYG